MDLSRRSNDAELMDTDCEDAADYAACLADLARVNRITFTHATTLRWLDRAMRNVPDPVRILDVACGHGDLLRAIAGRAAKRGRTVLLEGIDLNPQSAVAAAAATPAGLPITWRTGSVFDYLPDPKPDFIVSSQFTHHLSDAEVVIFLRWLDAHAARGWLNVDIHRHILAYRGFQLLSWAARWHRFVRYDGMVSVTRAFRGADWRRLIEQAGVQAELRWSLPFRHRISHLA
jgi:2-polyprenyl-3-methyl-5-hydroxy-6-metoxy-1,4-benzoquinol methylase